MKPSWQTKHRQQDVRMLREPRREQHQVVRFLGVLREELDDARVAHEHRVRVICVDVDRARERAVADRDDDGCAHRGGDVDHLRHQRKALRRRRGDRSRAGERRADRGGHRRMLGLDVDDLRVGLTVRDERRELLDDRRLRRDRVHRHDVRVDLAHGVSHGLAAGEQLRRLSPHRAPFRSHSRGRSRRRSRSPCSSARRSRRTSSLRARTAESGQ